MRKDVEHTEDCGTHAAGEPCCQGYIEWMMLEHPADYIAMMEAGLGEEE
jgi:hypothetical protein